jgi:uncharacterized protein
MTSPLQVKARKVRESGRLELLQTVPPEDFQESLGGMARLTGPLRVDLVFSARRGEVDVRGKVSGEWELECSRCLALGCFPYGAAVEGSFAATLESLDASEEVRQALHLALPMRIFCRPDCLGLCTRCGANKNAGACGCKEN